MTLEERITQLYDSNQPARSNDNLRLLAEFRHALNSGDIRVAEPAGDYWKVNLWVKKGLLLHIPMGVLQDVGPDANGYAFDLDTFPKRRFALEDKVRIPSGGSCIRDGAYLAPGVTCMPPAFVNVGVYVDAGSMLDSHVMVGICAQIGKRVQVSSGTQIGGLIHPLDRLPTILSDDVVIGGNCGIYDGVFLGRGAVVAAGTVLTGQSRVYDPLKKQFYKRADGQPLAIPANAIVLPGTVPITKGPARGGGISLQMPIIAGYRDGETVPEDFLDSLLD